MSKFKPCPFCGGEAELFMDNYQKCGVFCLNCDLYVGIELECGTKLRDGWRATLNDKESAIATWNRRYKEEKEEGEANDENIRANSRTGA